MKEPKLRFKKEDGVQFPDWEEKTFNDVADYKKGPFGSALKKKIFVPKSNNTVKVYEQQNAISKDWRLERYFVTDDYFQTKMKSFSVSAGDIIVSCAGTIGEIYELPSDAEEGIINQALMRVRIKKSVINSMVFKCVFDKMISSEGIKISNGSALKNIPPFADMKKQPVFLPSLPEQQKIASLFTELDNLIQSAENELEGYRELKQGMLQKMFPKKGEKVPEIRFPEFTGDWEQRKFGDVGSVAMCKRIFKEQTSDEGDVPFYKIGTFGGEPDAYISQELFDEYKAKYPFPNKGDILISVSGSIGRTVEFTGENEYFQDSNIVWLKHGKDIDNSFLKILYNVVEWSCEGSTIKRLYNDNFLKTEFMLPNIDEQKKIGEYFSNLDNLIASQQQELDGYKELKKGLLQQMFC